MARRVHVQVVAVLVNKSEVLGVACAVVVCSKPAPSCCAAVA